jgi:hypothetical protein
MPFPIRCIKSSRKGGVFLTLCCHSDISSITSMLPTPQIRGNRSSVTGTSALELNIAMITLAPAIRISIGIFGIREGAAT